MNIDKSNVNLERVKETAEKYYRDGDFYCSEAVIKTIKDEFKIDISDDIIAMASGFPVGVGGSGCTCGAVSGGIMALGLVFGRNKAKGTEVDKTMVLSKELHDYFRAQHKTLCCRILTKGMTLGAEDHMNQCISFTGEIAEKVAEIIEREA